MEGYIGLYRQLLEKPIWKLSTPEQKTILVTILLMVNHKEAEWEWQGSKFKINPGQTVTSLESIVKNCGKGVTIQNVRTALVRFEKLGFLTNKSTKTGRLISIDNWELYQVELKQSNKGTNKDLTKSQQRGNKDLTPNNNDNNVNNDNKYIYSSDSNEYRLAVYLFKYIKSNNDKAKEPKYNTWAKEFDKILRIDNRDLEELKQVIKFSQQDSFWFANILSPRKLREKYDQLLLKMKAPKGQTNQKNSNFNNFEQREFEPDIEKQLREKSVTEVEDTGEGISEQLKKIREGG